MATPKLSVNRVIIAISLVSLVVQIVASKYLIAKINQPLHVDFIVAAVMLEFLAFAILVPFTRSFYAREKVTFRYGQALSLLLASESFSHLIPFGDFFVQRYYFKRHKLPRSAPLRYVTVLYSFGLISIISLFLSFQLFVFILYPSTASSTFARKFIYVPLILTVLIIGLYLLRHSPKLAQWVQRACHKYLGSPLDSPFHVLQLARRPLLNYVVLIAPLFITWILEGFSYVCCLKAFNVHAPILLCLYGYTFVKMFRFLPIFPGGVGEIETASTILFGAYGYAIAPIVTGSILFRFVSYWFPLALGAISARSILRR